MCVDDDPLLCKQCGKHFDSRTWWKEQGDGNAQGLIWQRPPPVISVTKQQHLSVAIAGTATLYFYICLLFVHHHESISDFTHWKLFPFVLASVYLKQVTSSVTDKNVLL